MTRTWTPGTRDESVTALAETPRLVVALDFDGTASPLVDEPMSARVLPEVRAQLDRLLVLPETTVAYVSGRSMHDLREIAEHTDDSDIVLVGSHGAQYWYPGQGEVDTTARATEEGAREAIWADTAEILREYPEVILEPKTFGMGVHARRATPEDEAAAFDAITALVAERQPTWRRRSGHHIVEFSSRAEGKDAAIAVLRERFSATGILFAGDDVTDEDAMRVLLPGDLGVRVGPGASAAALRVESPEEIALLLQAVADERRLDRE